MARGQYLDPRAGRMTLATWADTWLDRPGKRAASVARDRQGLAAFRPHLGAIPLAAITPTQVQGAVDARSRLGRARDRRPRLLGPSRRLERRRRCRPHRAVTRQEDSVAEGTPA